MKQKFIQTAKQRARELRKKQTEAEKIFWEAVRNRRFMDKKFLRQHPLHFKSYGAESFFISDFYCHEHKLVIELDGEIHDNRKEEDEIRTEIINALKLKVVRFKNEEVIDDLENVLKKLEVIMNES